MAWGVVFGLPTFYPAGVLNGVDFLSSGQRPAHLGRHKNASLTLAPVRTVEKYSAIGRLASLRKVAIRTDEV